MRTRDRAKDWTLGGLLGVMLATAAAGAGMVLSGQPEPPLGNMIISIPSQVNGTLSLKNEITGQVGSVDTVQGQKVNLYLRPTLSPPTPPTGAGGAYGDDWPELEGRPEFTPPDNGKVNNRHFNGEVIRGGKYADRGFGLRLMDCTGTVYIERAYISGNGQGIAVGMDAKKDVPAVRVIMVECVVADNYNHQDPPDLPAQVGIYYHSPAPHDVGVGGIELYGCAFVNNGVGPGDANRLKYSSQYHHSGYFKGNAVIKARDCAFVNSSCQDLKAIGHTADIARCAFIGGAVGVNIGQDAEQQDKTGRWQMTATIRDSVFVGKGDVPPNNQRLGWGIVAESADAEIIRCVFAAPKSDGQRPPAIRCNAVRDYPVNLTLVDNVFSGYTTIVEVSSKDERWGPTITGQGNVASPGTIVTHTRLKGEAQDVGFGLAFEAIGDVRLDETKLGEDLKARRITSADIIADVLAQVE